ncbi:ACT domain-containing protein [Exilibacterium tricleocarpae]|uniref:ACT domain-containing protein n=1 Tax=Exilibacterium tricleocarpae TaxID=2591008 RepID=A0A545TYV5_9GAMM|nr:ACT domain-containing protein [Exilibacterium tricleocarpae]TQV82400.1 ACT domain-containing protein [Exilibacterium tricleocarpae]
MSGIVELEQILRSLQPNLGDGEFVFCTFTDMKYGDHAELTPLGVFQEPEGMTLIVPRHRADRAGIEYDACFRQLTLTVHSSLNTVGLTATVAGVLAEHGISANVVAAFYHDHVFVPTDKAEEALVALQALQG